MLSKTTSTDETRLTWLAYSAEGERRALVGSEPVSLLMMAVGAVALIANIYCLRIISKHKSDEVHMRAS